MRLKTYQGASMQEVMEMVRRQLGEDAIIVATSEDPETSAFRVTAAVEEDDAPLPFADDEPSVEAMDRICAALDRQGTPPDITDAVLDAASQIAENDPAALLAAALDLIFRFEPLPDSAHERPLMLIGPPGSGKTATLAKLATRALINQTRIAIITTDTIRAGAVEQFRCYAQRLGVEMHVAEGPDALAAAIDASATASLVLIDTTSVNPFLEEELARLEALVDAADAEPVLVLQAGRETQDLIEILRAFERLDPRSLVVTGLDLTRRLGTLLAAGHVGSLAFGEASDTPAIAGGLKPLNPVALARLLLSAAWHEPNSALPADEDQSVERRRAGSD